MTVVPYDHFQSLNDMFHSYFRNNFDNSKYLDGVSIVNYPMILDTLKLLRSYVFNNPGLASTDLALSLISEIVDFTTVRA